MSAPDAAPLPTRQQLDEIDVLLRRMLSLPSLAPEQPAAPVIRETSPPGDPVQSWRVQWTPPVAPTPSVAAWGTPAPVDAPPPWTNNLPSQPLAFVAPPAPAVVPLATAVDVPRVSPIVVLNGAFDLLTHIIPLGGWLRGSGRSHLGWAGIGMIAAGMVWAVGNWLGYEWPRLPGR